MGEHRRTGPRRLKWLLLLRAIALKKQPYLRRRPRINAAPAHLGPGHMEATGHDRYALPLRGDGVNGKTEKTIADSVEGTHLAAAEAGVRQRGTKEASQKIVQQHYEIYLGEEHAFARLLLLRPMRTQANARHSSRASCKDAHIHIHLVQTDAPP